MHCSSLAVVSSSSVDVNVGTYTHTTLFTKAWQIQNIDISVRKENKYIYIYKQKINRCKVILTTIN